MRSRCCLFPSGRTVHLKTSHLEKRDAADGTSHADTTGERGSSARGPRAPFTVPYEARGRRVQREVPEPAARYGGCPRCGAHRGDLGGQRTRMGARHGPASDHRANGLPQIGAIVCALLHNHTVVRCNKKLLKKRKRVAKRHTAGKGGRTADGRPRACTGRDVTFIPQRRGTSHDVDGSPHFFFCPPSFLLSTEHFFD